MIPIKKFSCDLCGIYTAHNYLRGDNVAMEHDADSFYSWEVWECVVCGNSKLVYTKYQGEDMVCAGHINL